MTLPLESLTTALADRYRIERELGRGGMATVYLAEDVKHHRQVAVKVLRPELASLLGPERFQREIQLAARLQHPHILPVFDSGTWGQDISGPHGMFYVMPYVAGESLRGRLEREPQLPLDEALQITREVAAALGHAHQQGIIHRDIKPENILLSGGHAVVADFGIARALDVAGGQKLTETGMALGTPAYMSPEQGSGDARLDGRSDLYALGVVLYEMLAGAPPFTGPTSQSIRARHAIDPIPSLRTVRTTVPESVEAAITKALAKVPADRFATTAEFVVALDGRGGAIAPPLPARNRLARRPSPLTAGVLVGLLLAAVLAAVRWWPAASPALNQHLVAVVPFRVTGGDPSLADLREGMMDLMAAKLNGDAGPRAVDPRLVLRLWNDRREDRPDVTEEEGVSLAREAGAGMVVLGSVVGTPSGLVLSASVLDVAAGRSRHQASVEGTQDSLMSLVDQLTVRLLALSAGVEAQRLGSLTSASLPAVREYLNGRAAARAGRWTDAIVRFNQALDLDSTFAIAGMNLAAASVWQDGSEVGRGRRLAWAARDRLSLRDRSLLQALRTGRLRALEDFVQKYPDVPEAWSTLGDKYYHEGPLLGVADAPARALDAFRRAIALDPDTAFAPYAEPMVHLADLALATGDTAGAARLLTRLLASDSTGEAAAGHKLALAELSGDTAKVTQLLGEFVRLGWQDLVHIVIQNQQSVTRVLNAQPALDAFRRVGDAPPDLVRMVARGLALNRGRPREALSVGDVGDFNPRGHRRVRITDALYWGGDTTAASIAADSLARLVTAPPPPATDPELHAYFYDVCVLEQWRLANDDFRTAPASIVWLRAAAVIPRIAYPEEHQRCADLLDAWLALATRRPDALQRMLRVDSLQIQEPSVGVTASPITASNLIMARLWRMQGDWPRAEAAARRRYTGLMPEFLSTYLLEEGRAAAQVGHREAAIRALRHYLALRYDPEPSVKPEVDQVRGELARLLDEPQ